jgi:peptidoglycan/xylan/chitin deacetylase (PgdA/CDA1 family)
MQTLNPHLAQWRPSLLIKATLWLHAAMLLALVVSPDRWRWILAAFCMNHLLLTAAGMWPRSTWLGPNHIRLPPESAARNEIALTIDDGPDPEVTPQVLELLDRHGVKATFFCVGQEAARYPDLCKAMVERGHAVENHTQRHPHYFAFLGPAGLTREIQAAQDTLAAITGRAPRLFRAPAGLRNPFLDPVLARLGLHLAAWTRRGFDTRSADAGVVYARLMKGLKPGSILLMHDGNSARSADGTPVILQVLPVLLDAAAAAGLRFVLLHEACDTGRRSGSP